MKAFLRFLRDRKLNASCGTTLMSLSLKHSVTIVQSMHTVYLPKIISWEGPKTLKSLKGQTIQKCQEELPHRPILKKLPDFILFGTKAGFLRRAS